MPHTTVPARAVARRIRVAALFCFAACLTFAPIRPAHAATPLDSVYTTDGIVSAVATTGTRTFIGGNFTRLGSVTGNITTFLPAALETTPGFRMNSGGSIAYKNVFCSIPDGNGGWYVGGTFTQWQGQARQSLAHVLADGTLSPFAPAFSGSGPFSPSGVRALALVGNRLYVGGDLTTLGGQPCGTLLAFDDDSSTPIDWTPGVSGSVYSLATSGDTLFAGGLFRTVAGQARPCLAAFDVTSGALLPQLYPGPQPGGYVTSLGTGDGTLRVGGNIAYAGAPTGAAALVDSTSGAALAPYFDVQGIVLAAVPDGAGGWFLGGKFGAVHGTGRVNLAHVGPDGMPTSWNPAPNDTVHALAMAGDTLYVGGAFTQASATARMRLAAYRASTELLLTGTPSVDGSVKSLLVAEGKIYLGGPYSSIGGLLLEGLASLDRSSWALTVPQPPGCGRLVNTLLAAHGRMYVGGAFTTVTTPASRFALTDTLGAPAPGLPLCDGNVEAIESDGAGGWFVGGYFSSIDGVARRSLAHLLPSGRVDMAWNAGLIGTPSIAALARVGNRLYVGGYSLLAPGGASSPLVALDVTTAALVPWTTTLTLNSGVSALCANADTVWIGGTFSTANGQARSALASVLASTGELTSWAPLMSYTSNAPSVFAIQHADGIVYAGGLFSQVGGLNRSSFAAVDAVTGVPTSMIANVTNSGPGIVRTMQLGATHVFLGGSFTAVNGTAHVNVVGCALTTGQALGWNVAPNGEVLALSLWGSKLYMGGVFMTIAATARARGAAINAFTGALDSWNPNSGDAVRSIRRSDASVAFGGYFSSLGSTARVSVCAVDPSTNALLPFAPNPNGEVRALAASDQMLYLGGQFTAVNGLGRVRFAELTTAGTLTSWSPSPAITIHAIAVHGSRVYLGGEKQQAGYVGAWDRTSHVLQSWSCNPVGVVRLLRSEGALLVGGACTGIGGGARTDAFALRADIGSLLPWAPRFNMAPERWRLHGGRWYACGPFASVNDTARYGMAAFDQGSGALLTWSPGFNSTVQSFDFAHDTLIAGGVFTIAGGATHRYFVTIDEATGAPLGIEHSANGAVESLCLSNGQMLMTGRFSSFPMLAHNSLAALDERGRVLSWNTNVTGSVLSLAVSGGQLYAAGNFWLFDAPTRDFAASFDTATAAVGPWAPQPDGTVYTLSVAGNSCYVGGVFSLAGGLARRNLVETDLATGAATAWNPSPNSSVFAIARDGANVYVGGAFSTIGGQPRNRIAALDATTGLATSWNPNANAQVNAIVATPGAIYAGGTFGTIGGATRRKLAALSPSTGLAAAWDPGLSASSVSVSVLDAHAGQLFVGGNFPSVANGAATRTGVAVFDLATGQPTPFTADQNATVYGFAHANGTLYVAGDFSTISGQNRPGLAGFVDPSWNLELLDVSTAARGSLALAPAAPQPLRSRGVLRFSLPAAGRVRLALHDLAGRETAVLLDESSLAAGPHEVPLDAGRLQPGVYWARLQWNGETRVQRVVTLH